MALMLEVSLERPEDKLLLLAAEVIQAGGVIVYPTETLYGIGANAWDGAAIAKVRAIKLRTDQRPILVVIHSAAQLDGLTVGPSDEAKELMDRFWPGPLTLIFHASKQVPDLLSRGSGTIGVRIPSSRLCLRLLELCGCPLTSTSANLSGQPTLRKVQEIRRSIPKGIDLYLNAGELPETPPSTVVDTTVSPPQIVRAGAVDGARLRSVIPGIR